MATKPVPGSEIQVALGRAFLRERSRFGVTLDQIAKALKTCVNTIRWHEAGARSLRADDLIAAAGVIGCAPTELMRFGADPVPATDQPTEERGDEPA